MNTRSGSACHRVRDADAVGICGSSTSASRQALSMALFLMVNLTNNHSDVFIYVRYISFTYSLMGVYLACQGLFSSLDSSITVFSVVYYGCGCFLFLSAGFLIFSHGYTEALGIISAVGSQKMDVVAAKAGIRFEHDVEVSLASLEKELHEDRLQKLRAAAESLKEDEWRYDPIEKLLGL
ncbi:hypothetical protein HPB47_003395 [Ixodes persulcatus]|uniref:Uncharacterized protein n=1 Tax=Ixodes persulcatus TaxID=34615 RepID=A0AC60PJP5_IXOPE|nr:hypothetical protein HPB47_003395 [Ixodes persulcatus]